MGLEKLVQSLMKIHTLEHYSYMQKIVYLIFNTAVTKKRSLHAITRVDILILCIYQKHVVTFNG